MTEVLTTEDDIRTDAFNTHYADDDTAAYKLIGEEYAERYIVELRDLRDNPDAVDRAGDSLAAGIRVFKEDKRRKEDLRPLIKGGYSDVATVEDHYNRLDSVEACEAVEPFHVLDIAPALDKLSVEPTAEPVTLPSA
jgi:hypothetical protein